MPPVVLDARRMPPTIYENVDVTLARQYRDQARQASSDAAAVIEPIRDDALAAAGFATLASATTFAPKMSTGETTIVMGEVPAATHQATDGEVALGGGLATVGAAIPNNGRYAKQASGALWRTGDTQEQAAGLKAADAEAARASLANAINDADSLRTALSGSLSSGDGGFSQAIGLALTGDELNFNSGVYRIGGVSKVSLAEFSSITTSRALASYAPTKAGKFRLFGVNTLRVTDLGALIEAEAAQILTNPTSFSAWSTYNGVGYTITKTPGQVPTWDEQGAQTGTLLTSAHALAKGPLRSLGTRTSGTWTYSLILSKRDMPYALVYLTPASGQNNAWFLDWSGTDPVFSFVSGSASSATFERLADGLYRFILTATISAGALTFSVSAADASQNQISPGVGYKFMTVYHEQLESGATASSPIVTGPATRPADQFRVTLPAGSPNDRIIITYAGGKSEFLRSKLITPNVFDVVGDAGAAVGKVLTSIRRVLPDTTAVTRRSENGCTVFLSAWEGVFTWRGTSFPSMAAMVEAAGGTVIASDRLQIAGYIAPDAPNLLGAVDFSIDTQRWTATQGGQTSDTENSGGFWWLRQTKAVGNTFTTTRRTVRTRPGFAYKFSAIGKRGTIASSFTLAMETYGNSAFSLAVVSSGVTSTTERRYEVTGSSPGNGVMGVGMYLNGGTDGGTMLMRDPSLVEVRPSRDFPSGNCMFEYEVAIPAILPTATQSIFQLHCGQGKDTFGIELRAGGALWVRHQTENAFSGSYFKQNQVATVIAGQVIHLIAGYTQGSAYRVAVDGIGVELDSTLGMGPSVYTEGNNFSGTAPFTGTINKRRIWTGCETLAGMKRMTKPSTDPVWATVKRVDPMKLWLDGDSGMEWSSTGFSPYMAELGWDAISTAVGGTTLLDQRNRFLNASLKTDLGDRTWVWHDLDANGRTGGADITLDKQYVEEVITGLGHNRWLYMRSRRTDRDQMTQLYNYLWQKYGAAHVLDPWDAVSALAITDPAAAGYASDQAVLAAGRDASYYINSARQPDNIHIISTANRAIAVAVDAKLRRDVVML